MITLLAVGCSTTQVLKRDAKDAAAPESPAVPETATVLLMPMQVGIGQLTIGGLVEPKADWTEAARSYLLQALEHELSERQASLIPYVEPSDDPDKLYEHMQVIKLHKAVGKAIVAHKLGNGDILESKKGKFDWELGPSVQALRDDYHADYALFVNLQRIYATEERQALHFALSLLYLFPFPTGSGQLGFASLVDLRTGHIVWFSKIAGTQGDLRKEAATTEVVDALFQELPL